MIHPSTILIADLTGYTDFLSSTELEHSSHILNELLELIVEGEGLGLTVSEIEGDAVLFYKTGEAIPGDDLVKQCLGMFDAFHRRLKLIERDTVCPCGVCQNTSNLGLKFVAHFGALKEISIASFTKASGLDMIVAHRLLKNDLQAREYVLVTDRYLAELQQGLGCDLDWKRTTQSYADIGDVDAHYALLDQLRAHIPDPPPRSSPVIPTGDDSFSLVIEAPLIAVYARLIDVERKPEWIVGLDGVDRADMTARIEEHHTCYFQGMAFDFTLVHGEIGQGRAVYSEIAEVQGTPYRHQQTFTLTSDGSATTVDFEVAWGDEPPTPTEMRQLYLSACSASFEKLKRMCEA